MTDNGGTTWSSLSGGTTENLTDITFTDNNTGYVVGYDGTILRTTDGGANWSTLPSLTDYKLTRIMFPGPMTGYIVGHADFIFPLQAMVLRTLDGGSSWTSMLLPTDNKLYSLYFTDDNIGYVAGSGGSILKTTEGTFVSIVEARSGQSDCVIFPNPTHDLINIGIKRKISEDVLIRILSIAGKQVMLKKFCDQCRIQIDISSLSKGIYMVTIDTLSGKETKKLVKL
jgi:hypothetical protein